MDDLAIKELALGRFAGPYTEAELEAAFGSPVRSAPLTVVPKSSAPGELPKWRDVENCSYPYKPVDGLFAVNQGLESDLYRCKWTKICEIMELLRSLTQLWAIMTLDFKEGFYHIPLFPRARAHLCVSWRASLYIRKVASFGVTTTPGIFGNLVDATLAIIENEIPGTKGVNQVDDVFIAHANSSVCNED